MLYIKPEEAEEQPTVVYDNNLWRLTMEEEQDVVMLHCNVKDWGAYKFKEMFEQWVKFVGNEPRKIYAWCPDGKCFKFALMLGMSFVDLVENTSDGSIGYLTEME